jgi:hypothetical protein
MTIRSASHSYINRGDDWKALARHKAAHEAGTPGALMKVEGPERVDSSGSIEVPRMAGIGAFETLGGTDGNAY